MFYMFLFGGEVHRSYLSKINIITGHAYIGDLEDLTVDLRVNLLKADWEKDSA